MKLPDYFLADLPPEAPLTRQIIIDSCQTLRRNRDRFLIHRSTNDIISLLCEVASSWLDPENPIRKLALANPPEAVGFSSPILALGLDRLFKQFTAENFRLLLAQELGSDLCLDEFVRPEVTRVEHARLRAFGPAFLVHLTAGNVPSPALMSITLGLLTRSAQFVKCASGSSLLIRLFAHSLYAVDPKLASCLEIAEWRGGSLELEESLFAEADCLTVTGSDETLAALRPRLPARTRFLGYGQQFSFGYIPREALSGTVVARTVTCAADDIVAWDQNGCLSPHAIYVEERGEVESDQFAALLAAELGKRETTQTRAPITTEAAAVIASRRSIYEALATHRADVKIWASKHSTAWTVVFEHDIRFQPSPGNRFVFVKPVPDLAAALRGVDDLRGKVSTVGLGGSLGTVTDDAAQFASWGATRICPLGQMQNPPLTWRHDGRPALADLVTWSAVEIAPEPTP